MKYFFTFFCILVLSFNSKAQKKKLVNKETGALVKPKIKENKFVVSSINAKYMLVDSFAVRIFALVEITGTNENTTFKQLDDFFNVQWSLQSEYGAKEKLKSGKVAFTNDFFDRKETFFNLIFEIPKLKNVTNAVLILDFIDQNMSLKYTNDLPIDFLGKRIESRFMVFNDSLEKFPNFQSFISVGKSFVIKAVNPSSEKLFLKKYLNKSLPALSPMSASKREVSDEFELVSTSEINVGDKISLKEEGLFVVSKYSEPGDDNYSFIGVDERFPRLTYAPELREALAYMSTPKEIEELKSTEDAKDALDLYFLNVCKGNQALAKQIIKSYYKRVADANKLFSTYKEGWKTDKGMVFVIMGPPSRVQRNRQREVWLYAQNQNNSEIIFTFYRKSNVFSDQSFELVRYPEYSSFWYPYVEAWRIGNVVE